jgi:hypothetical protein
VNEEEARAVMKAHGWTYAERRPKGVAKYVYAQRKRKGKLTDLYICPYSRLVGLTEADLVAKLEQPPPAEKS